MTAEKYESAYALERRIAGLVEAGALDRALRLIRAFVERIITEPLCTSQVFGSPALDALCQRIGQASLAAIGPAPGPAGAGPVCVYIVTKLQKSGGHTRVIEDFIESRPDALHVLLSTELDGNSDRAYFLDGVGRRARIALELAPGGDYLRRLAWLQTRLLALRPDKVYLFNHHQDSVAAAAIQPGMGLDAAFYHHGDHHLCLGLYLSHLAHIDPHPMGYHHCRDALGIENVYIPLTSEDKGGRPADWAFCADGVPTTCTAARSNKVEIPYFVNYVEMLPKILRATGGRHIHIGRLSPWGLRKIRRGLKRHGIDPARFVYIPWVASVWQALHEHRVDLYLASFPYGGGLTLIEAMGAGVPVVLHRHIYSRILSGIELAYPAAFSWRLPQELLEYCAGLNPAALAAGGRQARQQYETFHRRQLLPDLLRGTAASLPAPLEAGGRFAVAGDEWAFWMENQVSLKRVWSRAIYRALKRLRAAWQVRPGG